MTPKEKAKELVNKFTVVGLQQREESIECALICVDEIMAFCLMRGDFDYRHYCSLVKQEIEKL